MRESNWRVIIEEMKPEAFNWGGSGDEISQEIYRGDSPRGFSRGVGDKKEPMRLSPEANKNPALPLPPKKSWALAWRVN